MVENSLLDAYRKYQILKQRLYENSVHDKLKNRLAFYKQEGMEDEYSQTLVTIYEYEMLERELESLFAKPNKSIYVPNGQFSWVEYFKKADQLLFGQDVPEWTSIEYYETNDKLMEIVSSELNKKFPDEQWKFGELPLFHWQILNYPGYEPTESEIEMWENNPNIFKDSGYYFENSAKTAKCLYQSKVGDKLISSKSDLNKLADICDSAKENRQVYVIEREDDECSGGYDLGVEIEFKENATDTFYGTPLTPQEKVINDTVVREIDTQLAGSNDMSIIHDRLGILSDAINEFFNKNKFDSSSKKISSDSPESSSPNLQ